MTELDRTRPRGPRRCETALRCARPIRVASARDRSSRAQQRFPASTSASSTSPPLRFTPLCLPSTAAAPFTPPSSHRRPTSEAPSTRLSASTCADRQSASSIQHADQGFGLSTSTVRVPKSLAAILRRARLWGRMSDCQSGEHACSLATCVDHPMNSEASSIAQSILTTRSDISTIRSMSWRTLPRCANASRHAASTSSVSRSAKRKTRSRRASSSSAVLSISTAAVLQHFVQNRLAWTLSRDVSAFVKSPSRQMCQKRHRSSRSSTTSSPSPSRC